MKLTTTKVIIPALVRSRSGTPRVFRASCLMHRNEPNYNHLARIYAID